MHRAADGRGPPASGVGSRSAHRRGNDAGSSTGNVSRMRRSRSGAAVGVFLQNARNAATRQIPHRIRHETRCTGQLGGERQHLPQQRIGGVAAPHPVDEPSRQRETEPVILVRGTRKLIGAQREDRQELAGIRNRTLERFPRGRRWGVWPVTELAAIMCALCRRPPASRALPQELRRFRNGELQHQRIQVRPQDHSRQ